MMLNVVFYNSEAVIRVAEKAMKYFAGHVGLRTTVDTIWFNGLYLKFYPRIVTVNTYGSSPFSIQEIRDCLQFILKDEEVYIAGGPYTGTYINSVNSTQKSDSISLKCSVQNGNIV